MRLINSGDVGPTPVNLGGNCTCLHQAAIHRASPYREGNSGLRTMIATDCFPASWICVLVRQFIRLLTFWKTHPLSKHWNIMKVWIVALTLFLRCFQREEASLFSTVCTQAYYRSIIPSPCPSTQLTSPLCFKVESLNSWVRSKPQIQGGSAPQWWQTHWWLSLWGKLEGKDASVNTCKVRVPTPGLLTQPTPLLHSHPSTFCSYLYKTLARHNYSL